MSHLLDINCVFIGVNCSKTLGRPIDSVFASDYPKKKIDLYYIDGGSADRSKEVASGYDSVTVIALNQEYPAPGMGRSEAEANSDFWKYEFQIRVIIGDGFLICLIFSLLILLIHPSSAATTITLARLTITPGTTIPLNPRLFKVRIFMRENKRNTLATSLSISEI